VTISSVPDDGQISETTAFNAALEQVLARQPPLQSMEPAVVRARRLEGGGPFPPPVYLPQGVDRVVPGRAGNVGLRVFTPDRVGGVYLHIHGGGWTLGAANQQDPMLWAIAEQSGVAVVSVDYRLAPEHPYPAGPDDCEDAASWLVDHAAEEFGTDRLVIGGESAGAHLAVVTMLRLRDRGAYPGGFRGANLVFGAYDLSMTPSQRLWGERYLVLSTPVVRWFADHFLGDRDEEARRVPDVSPLYAELHDLPPALFTVGTQDPLLDDSMFMAARWRSAGNEASLEVFPEAAHGFTLFPIAAAAASKTSQIAFIREAVS